MEYIQIALIALVIQSMLTISFALIILFIQVIHKRKKDLQQ
jgi:hypothetical protein